MGEDPRCYGYGSGHSVRDAPKIPQGLHGCQSPRLDVRVGDVDGLIHLPRLATR